MILILVAILLLNAFSHAFELWTSRDARCNAHKRESEWKITWLSACRFRRNVQILHYEAKLNCFCARLHEIIRLLLQWRAATEHAEEKSIVVSKCLVHEINTHAGQFWANAGASVVSRDKKVCAKPHSNMMKTQFLKPSLLLFTKQKLSQQIMRNSMKYLLHFKKARTNIYSS